MCFIKDVSGNSFDSTNILMSVGVFTSESAAFYVMVGVCIGNNYSGVKQKGLSKTLFKNVAIMMKNETDFFLQKKNSFITRPLEKMGELLHLWTFKTPILVFIILVFSYLIFLNIFGLSIICSI